MGWRGVVLVALAGPLHAQSGVVEVTNARPPTRTVPESWQSVADRLTFYGDYRIRGESDRHRANADDRWRARLRLRLGANYSVSDELMVGGRVTTGNPDDARDTNTTLGEEFDKGELTLDRLFLTWRPKSADASFVTVGKFAHGLARNPIYEELVWYSNVQAEGILAGTEWRDVGPLESAGVKVGGYLFQQDSEGDVEIGVAEVEGSTTLSKEARLNLSAAWYGYTHAAEVEAGTVDEYQIIDVIAALTFDGAVAPWKVAFESVTNAGVSSPENSGWAAGVSYGQIRRRGDWRVYYQYQEIGNDAVFSPVAGADFLLDRNFHGHVFNADYRWTDASTLRLRVLAATPDDPSLIGGFDEDSFRVRLDYSVKF
ncbi:MAG: hypothetical protein ACJAQ3_000571 [Planctomycetota bacterium]|jgi:hypothetical protein